MIGDDLVGVLGGGPKPDAGPQLGFRQGLIAAWDPNTGDNQISVGGATLINVPILNTGEAIALKAGHVVGLLTAGSSWFILGRITPPDDPNFAAASVAFEAVTAYADNWSTSTADQIKATAPLHVPLWADEALITVTGQCGMHNSTAAVDFGYFTVGVNGATNGSVGHGYAPNGVNGQDWQTIGANHSLRFTGLSGGEILNVEGHVHTQVAGWAVNINNAMWVQASAVYKSNV